MNDLRFPTALQMVLSLAVARETGVRCTSAELAIGIGANPVLVRKLITPLARDGIVISTSGKNGGVRLAKDPEQITLREIYLSSTEDKRLFVGRESVPKLCVVSRNITQYYEGLTAQLEQTLIEQLGKKTLAESLFEVRGMERHRRA